MGIGKLFWGQPDKMLRGNLQWTSDPHRGSRNTPSHFMLQKLEISTGVVNPLAHPIMIGADFTYLLIYLLLQ